MLELFNRHLGPGWLDRHDDPAFWDQLDAIPDEDIWAARQTLRAELFIVHSRTPAATLGGRARQPAQIVRGGAMLDPDALTIGYRAPLHGLQAPGAHLPRPGAAGAHPHGRESAGADRVRRQGASRRRSREASLAAGVSAHARSDVRRARRLHRRLRFARRALPGRRLRRVAQQPAQAARSQRHQRHEGVAQRRAASERRRRLVGRRVQWQQRLADRKPHQPRRSRRRPMPPMPRRSIGCSKSRSCRRFTIATSARCRGGGSRLCAKRCAPTCRGSRPGGC